MDQPDIDPSDHVAALAALERINYWSGSARIVWRELSLLARRTPSVPLRVLDIASGGGDIPIRLWHKARRAGLELSIDGCDKSPTAIEHAVRRAKERETDVKFFRLDVLAEPIPAGYDVLTCSLFLHHLEDSEAIELLRRMAAAARRMVLVNDLVRSKIGYVAAYVGTRLLSTSRVTHVDGPLSVAGAYTPEEALELARQAGLREATVRRRWPFRFLLTWQPSGG